MKKDRRRHDQKRKEKAARKKRRDKLAKKSQLVRENEPLVYLGDKYKKDKLIPIWMQTEIGIYETFVMTDRKLLDQTVAASIQNLVKQMRAGTLPTLVDTEEICYDVGREEDFLIGNIRRRWARHFEDQWQPPEDKLIGVLRSILGSIEKVRSPGPRSQSYLHHIAGFLTKKLGVSVQQVSAEMKPLPEPEEDELVQIGREWILDQDQDASAEFHELASDLLKNGQAERVIDACHRLLGEESDPSSDVVAELIGLSKQARKNLVTAMG